MRIYIKLTLISRQNSQGHQIFIISVSSVSKYAQWGITSQASVLVFIFRCKTELRYFYQMYVDTDIVNSRQFQMRDEYGNTFIIYCD